MSGGLAVSLLLHALVAVFMIGGVGLALPEPPEVEAVEVEIVPPPVVPEQEPQEEPAPPPPAPPQVKPEPEQQPEQEVAEAPPPDILPAVQEFGDTDTQAEETAEEEAAEGPEAQTGPEQEEPEAGTQEPEEPAAEDSGAEDGTDTETSEGPQEEAEETTETPTPELPEVPEAEASVPEPEPERQPEPQPEAESEQEEEPAPEPEAEAEQPADPETVPEPAEETETAAAPEGTPEEDEGAEVAPEPQPEPEAEIEVAAAPQPEVQQEPEDFGTVGRIVTAQLPKAKPAVPRRTVRRSSSGSGGPRGAMTVARQLYSDDLTSDVRTRTAIRGMTKGERLNLLCLTELRGQLNNGNPPYFPDLMPSMRRTRGGTVLDPGGWLAFRSFGLWYNVTFRCEVDSTVRRVVSFRYRVGEPIPRSEWAERRLPAN